MKEIVEGQIQGVEYHCGRMGPSFGQNSVVLTGKFFQWKGHARSKVAPGGMIAPSADGNILILNGDTEGRADELDSYMMENDLATTSVTMSFICLKRLFKRKSVWQIPDIKILDYAADSYIRLTEAQKRARPETLRSPVGYTRINDSWHRSATVVFTIASDKKHTYLMGTDEGSYFGVKIPGRHTTVKDCYTALIPPVARGKPFRRQGEWFLVPVNASKVPAVAECIVTCVDPDHSVSNTDNPHNWSGFALPVTDNDSSRHLIVSDDIRVAKDGTVYARSPSLCHSRSQHKDVEVNGWVRFACNTAVRAVSVQGVD